MLVQVKRLLKQHDALDSTELLGRAARAEADLELWYDMEGAATTAISAAQPSTRQSFPEHSHTGFSSWYR